MFIIMLVAIQKSMGVLSLEIDDIYIYIYVEYILNLEMLITLLFLEESTAA